MSLRTVNKYWKLWKRYSESRDSGLLFKIRKWRIKRLRKKLEGWKYALCKRESHYGLLQNEYLLLKGIDVALTDTYPLPESLEAFLSHIKEYREVYKGYPSSGTEEHKRMEELMAEILPLCEYIMAKHEGGAKRERRTLNPDEERIFYALNDEMDDVEEDNRSEASANPEEQHEAQTENEDIELPPPEKPNLERASGIHMGCCCAQDPPSADAKDEEEDLELAEDPGKEETPPPPRREDPPDPEPIRNMEEPPEEEKSCLIPWFLAIILAVIAVIMGLHIWMLEPSKRAKLDSELKSTKAKLAAAEKAMNDAKAELDAAEAKLKECQEKAAKAAADEFRMKLATVRKNGGIETVSIEQLTFNPSMLDGVKVKVKGQVIDLTFKGSKSDHNALLEWSGWASDLLARNFGIVSGNNEVRIRYADKVAYLLEREGDGMVLKVSQKEADGYKLVYSLKTSAEKEGSFRGDKLQSFEYPYTKNSSSGQASQLPAMYTIQEILK